MLGFLAFRNFETIDLLHADQHMKLFSVSGTLERATLFLPI